MVESYVPRRILLSFFRFLSLLTGFHNKNQSGFPLQRVFHVSSKFFRNTYVLVPNPLLTFSLLFKDEFAILKTRVFVLLSEEHSETYSITPWLPPRLDNLLRIISNDQRLALLASILALQKLQEESNQLDTEAMCKLMMSTL